MATFIFEQESAGKTTGYNSGEKLEKRLLTWEPYTQAWTTSLALLACQLDCRHQRRRRQQGSGHDPLSRRR